MIELNQTTILIFSIGIAAGGFVAILISLIIFFVNGRVRANKEQEKEIIGKVIGSLMEDVNNLFTSYRLSDIDFSHMERESRELLSKISLEVRDNLSLINSGYITIIDRYIEEKTESLIAVKDQISNSHPVAKPQDMSVSNIPDTHVSDINSFDVNAPFNTPFNSTFNSTFNAPSEANAEVKVTSAPASVVPQKKGDSFEDLARFIGSDVPSINGYFGGGQETAAFGEAQEFRLDSMPPLAEPPIVVTAQVPPILAPVVATPVPPPARVAQPLQSTARAPDVDATQEFNLNDIMNSAQEMIPQAESDNGALLNGDDVASKLDSFFS